MNQQKPSIQIRASDDDLKGRYSNAVRISHSQEEFVMDFLMVAEQVGALTSRVLLHPGHAKRLAAALTENIKKYEAHFGPLAVPDDISTGFGFSVDPPA